LDTQSQSQPIGLDEESLILYHNIESALPSVKRTIQFVACCREEGTTTIVREFAKVCHIAFNKSVLLMEIAIDATCSDCETSLVVPEDAAVNVEGIQLAVDSYLNQINDKRTTSHLITISGESLSSIFRSHNIGYFMNSMKLKFDYILIDSPSINSSSEALSITSKVDTTILVLEAESTRWQLAANAKKKIEQAGGNVLGVILNKQRHYIPKFIYDRL
jgi:hypothetical protein